MTDGFDDLFEQQDELISRSEAKRLAKDEVQKTLADINSFAFQAQAAVSNAIREATAVHPDFQERRSRMLATLEEIPLLKDAVSAAENNPQLAGTLPAIYEIVYRASQAPAESTATAASATSASEPKPKLETQTQRPSDLDEDAMYQGALASQRISLAPENRKRLIESLEEKGVLDIGF